MSTEPHVKFVNQESELLLGAAERYGHFTLNSTGFRPQAARDICRRLRSPRYICAPLEVSGYGEILPVNMDVPSQMVNNYDFCLESKLLNNDGQLKGEGFTIPCQHPISYQSGFNASISMTDNISPQSIWFPKKAPYEPNAMKRDFFAQKDLQTAPYDVAGDNKRMKLSDLEQGLSFLNQQESAGILHSRLQVPPARRSQRLSDKITALQKLVSPYGKTDTASVLQEACLYIKLVQQHIQNLLQMQSSSYKSLNPQGVQQKQGNLRSEGLCLVPVTSTQTIAINHGINVIQPHDL